MNKRKEKRNLFNNLNGNTKKIVTKPPTVTKNPTIPCEG